MTDSSELAEFVAQAVDVGVVDAGEAPELLEGYERHARGGAAAQHAPAVSVAVDDDLGVLAADLHGREADGVHADHGASTFVCFDVDEAFEHLVEVAGDVGGVHDAFAGAVRVSLSTCWTAVTRALKGQWGPSDWSSSSLMKSMPASAKTLIERKSCFDPIGGKDAIFGRFLMVFCGHVVVLSVVNVAI